MQSNAIRKRDLIFLSAAALVIAVLFLLRGHLFGQKGTVAVLSQDGKEIARIHLDGNSARDIRIDAPGGGYNILHIEDGTIAVISADCPGGDCIRQGAVSHTGESIICLPHRLTVTVKKADGSKDDEREYDAIVR